MSGLFAGVMGLPGLSGWDEVAAFCGVGCAVGWQRVFCSMWHDPHGIAASVFYAAIILKIALFD